MRYYSTQRPIAPGTFPKPMWNKVVDVQNYDRKIYCEELGQEAWGHIDYERPLDPKQAASYELYPAPCRVKSLWFVGKDYWKCEVYRDEDGNLWKFTEPGPMPRERHDGLNHATGNDIDGEPGWPMPPDVDYRIEGEAT